MKSLFLLGLITLTLYEYRGGDPAEFETRLGVEVRLWVDMVWLGLCRDGVLCESRQVTLL